MSVRSAQRNALHHGGDKRNKWNPSASLVGHTHALKHTHIWQPEGRDMTSVTRKGFRAFFNSNPTASKSYFPFSGHYVLNFASHKSAQIFIFLFCQWHEEDVCHFSYLLEFFLSYGRWRHYIELNELFLMEKSLP